MGMQTVILMSEAFIALGYTALVLAAIFGASECYDAYKYRHHPTESLKREVVVWGGLVLAWAGAVTVAAVLFL